MNHEYHPTIVQRVRLHSSIHGIIVVSCPDPPSGGCGEREKEGLRTRLV